MALPMNVSGLRRNIKNIAHNYTDAQVCVFSWLKCLFPILKLKKAVYVKLAPGLFFEMFFYSCNCWVLLYLIYIFLYWYSNCIAILEADHNLLAIDLIAVIDISSKLKSEWDIILLSHYCDYLCSWPLWNTNSYLDFDNAFQWNTLMFNLMDFGIFKDQNFKFNLHSIRYRTFFLKLVSLPVRD